MAPFGPEFAIALYEWYHIDTDASLGFERWQGKKR